MIIETKVPVDIRKYETKLIGPFTARQTLCCAIAVGIDIPVCMLLFHSDFGLQLMVWLVILIDVPVMLFAMNMHDMPMFQYLRCIIIPSFLAPTKRKNITKIEEHKETKDDKNALKEREKREQKAARQNPIYQAYK